MPIFMKPENMKWIYEIQKEDGCITYRAKKDAPKEIKESVKTYKRSYYNHTRNEIKKY